MAPTSGFVGLLSFFLFVASVYAAQSPFGLSNTTSEMQDILWERCSIFDINSQDPWLSCAYHEVPMDYHDPHAGKARLAVAKYDGSPYRKIGTLFVPGGPEFIAHAGQSLVSLFQGAYDIVSWDPRGFGTFTFPGAVTCFESKAEEDAFFQNSIFESINYTIAGRFDKQDLDELFSRMEESSRLLLEFGERCRRGPVGNFLQYIGTSSNVRDLASLGDHLVGKDKPIDYWGLSYGATIGINFLNMFPERAGHIVLDGVDDPNTWASHKTARTSLADSEKTYSALTDACAASGKAGCKLVELVGDYASGQDIKRLINDAHDTALKLLRTGFDQLFIRSSEMRDMFHAILAVPTLWSDFVNRGFFDLLVVIFQTAQAFDIPYNGTYHVPPGTVGLSAQLLDRTGGFDSNLAQSPGNRAFAAIVGADNFVDIENHVVMKDVLDEIVNVTRTVAPTFGATWRYDYNFRWPVRSVERLPPFDFSRVKDPVLVIGNTADPFTPFAGAQAVANLIGNHATLVEQLGVGHRSLAQFSPCTLTIMIDYFVTSKLPDVPNGEHIKCEVYSGHALFPPINAGTPVIPPLG